VVIQRWRQYRARRRAEKERESQRIQERTWAIFREVTDPLVADGLAHLSRPLTEENHGRAPSSRCAALDPVRDGCAAVWVEPVGTSWINLAVGEPFPGGAVYELDISEGWEDELRSCLQAVVDGRYRDRIYEARLGEVWEMIFELPGEERVIGRQDLSGSGYDTEPREY
jgi:hypothetical protein